MNDRKRQEQVRRDATTERLLPYFILLFAGAIPFGTYLAMTWRFPNWWLTEMVGMACVAASVFGAVPAWFAANWAAGVLVRLARS